MFNNKANFYHVFYGQIISKLGAWRLFKNYAIVRVIYPKKIAAKISDKANLLV
jgi:hypothetical protein